MPGQLFKISIVNGLFETEDRWDLVIWWTDPSGINRSPRFFPKSNFPIVRVNLQGPSFRQTVTEIDAQM